jgi:hypothetical protein
MSFYNDASLVFLPSGGAGKDGKAYSIKPTDGSGDFTFSRGSNLTATRVDSNGLIEKGRENLLLQSNSFDTTWFLSDTSVTSGQSGYDGSNDAWLLNSTTTGSPRIQQIVSLSGVATYSVYAKAATDSFIQIRTFGANSEAWFNLSSGTIAAAYGSQYITSNIQSVGNGWYRCSVTFNGSLTTLRIYPASAFGVYSTSGNGVYIQDAQLEQGLIATEPIESGATTGLAGILEDSPRFDYSGGATCPSLLLEPQRTNLIEYSEYFEGSGWTAQAGITLTANTTETLSPEGLNNAYKVVSTDATKGFYFSGLNITNAAVRTIYLKGSVGGETIVFKDPSGFGTPSTKTLTTDWQRFEMATTNDGNTYQGLFIDDISVGTIYAYGAQVEEGSYPTSYIPNHSGGSVTRGADSSNITSGLSIGNGSEFGLYYEIDVDAIPRNSSSPFIQIQFTTANGGVGIKGASDAIANYIDLYGTTDFSKYFSARSMGNGIIKFFINYSSGTGDFYLNGTKYTGAISGSTSGCEIDSVYLLGSAYKLKAKQILIFPTALSDAECITLTS